MQNDNLQKLEYELSRRHEQFKKSTPYQIFEVWEGCGRDVVQTRYYELVKIHHPDRYGGNLTSKLKKLSQSIFLLVQDAYQTLGDLEDGPQKVGPPEEERAKALANLSSGTSPRDPSRAQVQADRIKANRSSQYKRMRRSDVHERLSNKSIFEAVTISERDASTLEEDSLPEEERRAKLAKLARTARSKTTRPPISQVLAHQGSLEEDSSLSVQERREKLAALSKRQKTVPAGFTTSERTPSKPGLTFDSVPLADTASSGHIRGISSQEARRQASISSHQEHFSQGVTEMREARYRRAFELVEKAFEAKPDENRYKTYYAYLLFMTDAEQKDRAQQLLREVLDLKDKQTAPDANLFIGYIYKTSEKKQDQQRAFQHFRKALELNPSNHEAAREVRLYEMRQKQESSPRLQDDVGGFFKKLFKK